MFRHTYCATRLQTIDRGAPVSVYTVARELGHGRRALVNQIYGHLGNVRHRSETVEYRIEQHLDLLGDRLQRLGRYVTGNVTAADQTQKTEQRTDAATYGRDDV